ncbi:MAG: flavodoxin family protein [Candidatus Thorarchaeota archaeon]
MRILALLGTPRKENTYKMIKLLEESLISNGNKDLEFEYLFLDELDLGFCKSCFSCYNNGEQTCPKANKTLLVLEKMNAAQGLIFASPVYCDSYSALMKTFIDHLAFLNHRPRLFDKKAIILSTTHESGTKYTMEFLEQTARRWGCEVVDSLGVKMMQYTYREKYRNKIHKEIEKLAKKFTLAINENWHSSPTLSDLIHFRIMRTWTSIIAKEVNKTDYNYWKEHDWFNKKYYFSVKINPFKNLLASFISWRVKKAIER